MTIEYKDSKRIVKLSTDTVETTTYETDFSSNTGWTTSNSSKVDIDTSANELQIKENGGTLAQMYYDLGASVSTTKWVIRCRILVNGNANTDEVLFKLELNDTSNASSNTNSDALGFYVYWDRNNTWSRIYQVCKDNTTSVQGLSATPAYYGNISNSTYYYITLTRSSATDFEVKIRTGSHSGTVLGTLTQSSIPSGLTGLRYLTAQNYLQGQGQTMDISEVEFYNGVTSLTSKPTDVQDNSILVEKDTARRYWFDDSFNKAGLNAYFKFDEASGDLINQASNVGSTDEISGNGTNSNVTYSQTGKIGSTYSYNGTNSKTEIDTLIPTSQTGSVFWWWKSSDGIDVIWGWGDTNADTFIFQEGTGSGESFTIYARNGGANKWWAKPSSNISSPLNTWHSACITHDGTAPLIYVDGVEGTTFTNSTDKTWWVPDFSGIDNFSLGFERRNNGLHNYFNGNIDELSVWSRALTAAEILTLHNSGTGKTIDTAKGATWTMEPTFRDDFSTDNWDNMSSRINVNTTTEKLDFAMYRDGANDSAVYDLGAGNVSDTAWVLRWKMNFTAVYASGNGNRLWFGLSSLPQTTNQGTAQDSIMMYQNHDGTDCFSASYSNNAALPQTNTENPDYATGTDYYCELKRTSSTTIESRMWTGGYDGTLLSNAEDSVSNSTIGSVTGLRYVKMSNIYASQGGSVITGTIDDLEFYNGVTSIN